MAIAVLQLWLRHARLPDDLLQPGDDDEVVEEVLLVIDDLQEGLVLLVDVPPRMLHMRLKHHVVLQNVVVRDVLQVGVLLNYEHPPRLRPLLAHE